MVLRDEFELSASCSRAKLKLPAVGTVVPIVQEWISFRFISSYIHYYILYNSACIRITSIHVTVLFLKRTITSKHLQASIAIIFLVIT